MRHEFWVGTKMVLSDQYAQIFVSRRSVFDRQISGHKAAPLG
jgi:hypothetical protein